MEKSASAGVKAISTLIIIGSLLSLSGFLVFHDIEGLDTFNIIRPAAFYFSIILGIFLFRLKNWARLAIIAISLLLFIETTIAADVLSKNIEVQSGAWKKDFDKDTERQLSRARWSPFKGIGIAGSAGFVKGLLVLSSDIARGVAKFLLIIAAILSGLFNIMVVFFFTRRGVARQFQ